MPENYVGEGWDLTINAKNWMDSFITNAREGNIQRLPISNPIQFSANPSWDFSRPYTTGLKGKGGKRYSVNDGLKPYRVGDKEVEDAWDDDTSKSNFQWMVDNVVNPIVDYFPEATLNSGYRSREKNRNTPGAAKNSDHVTGSAVDLGFPSKKACVEAYKWVENSSLAYDKLILENKGDTWWIHVSANNGRARRKKLRYTDHVQIPFSYD